ncbi:hypothetical protein MFIFM68171_10142 [Madurella fahalii]|uniref:Myb-like domain-containing protein n=1 Tax=Madurella fahalii TaxID=1157608 RepID=A0ABQ0GQB5_9PEZI
MDRDGYGRLIDRLAINSPEWGLDTSEKINRAAPEARPRLRHPPRHPNRDAGMSQGTESDRAELRDWGANADNRGYLPRESRQTMAGSGASYQQASASTAAPPIPTYHAGPLPAPPDIQMGDVTLDDEDPAAAALASEQSGEESAVLSEYPYSVYNPGTWTAADDRTLMLARSRGQNWADLQRAHFPTKTANACRKRYERLMERRGMQDYSTRRMEMVAHEYMNMRKGIWSGLAERVGMKWEIVEALCMSAGLRTIQSNARSYTNRARRDNRLSQRTWGSREDAGPVPLPSGPVGTEFGTAFVRPRPEERGTLGRLPSDADGNSRSGANLMPPPPLIHATGAPFTGTLPPIPQMPFPPDANRRSNLGSGPFGPTGPPEEPPPAGRGSAWQGPHFRGPL